MKTDFKQILARAHSYVSTSRISGAFVILIVLYSSAWALYFSLTSKLGTPPDELYHIGIINQFSKLKTIFLSNSPETYVFGDVTRTPFLYHLFIGKIQAITPLTLSYIHLRFVNVLLGLFYYFFSFKFISYLTKSNFSRLLFITFLSFTPMIPFLFGSLTYDNFTNLFSIISLYLFVLYIKENNIRYFYLNIVIGIVGILSKFTFLPLFIIEFLIMGLQIFKNFRKDRAQCFQYSSNKFLIFTIALLLLIPVYFYGVNIITYKNYAPSCIEVLTHEQCLNNGNYVRALGFQENNKPVTSSIYTFYDYTKFWFERLFETLFSIFGHTFLGINRNFVAIIISLVAAGILITVRRARSTIDLYLISIMLFYASILLFTNYKGYISTGIKPLAIQGRYIIPVIPLFYYLISKYFGELLRGFPIVFKILIILLIISLLNKYTYFNFYHQIKLSEGFSSIEIPAIDNLIKTSYLLIFSLPT